MPTVHRWQGWRFFFYSNEGREPAHIDVQRGDAAAKIWLHDLSVAYSYGVKLQELSAIVAEVRRVTPLLQEAWHGYFGD